MPVLFFINVNMHLCLYVVLCMFLCRNMKKLINAFVNPYYLKLHVAPFASVGEKGELFGFFLHKFICDDAFFYLLLCLQFSMYY